MNLDGELRLRVELEQQHKGVRVVRAGIECARPQVASQVFAGRLVEDVAAMVPRLFSVCGRAQGIASALACEAACGVETTTEITEARKLLAGMELVQEGLWRTLLDWPRTLGMEPSTKDLAVARGALDATASRIGAAAGLAPASPGGELVASANRQARALAGDVLSRQVLGTPSASWDELCDVDGLAGWSALHGTAAARLIAEGQQADARLGASDVALMPRIAGKTDARTLATAIEADLQFAHAPKWKGRPAETGPLARMHARRVVASVVEHYGRSALARFVARLSELCSFVSGALPEVGSSHLGKGWGIGWVETSRGLLIHHVRLDENRVRAYQIVAPTEWNFHPQGAFSHGIEGRNFVAEGAVRRAINLLVHSLDPCVAWKAEFGYV